MLLTVRFTWPPVPPFTTCAWIVATMPPFDALNLEPGPDDTCIQVHIRPAEAERLTLADAEGKRGRPPGAVSLPCYHVQDAPGFLASQGLDLMWSGRGG